MLFRSDSGLKSEFKSKNQSLRLMTITEFPLDKAKLIYNTYAELGEPNEVKIQLPSFGPLIDGTVLYACLRYVRNWTRNKLRKNGIKSY